MGFFDRFFSKKEKVPFPISAPLPISVECVAKYSELLKGMEKPSILLEIDKDFKGDSSVGSKNRRQA